MIMVAMVTVALGYGCPPTSKYSYKLLLPVNKALKPELDCNLVCVQLTDKLVHGVECFVL